MPPQSANWTLIWTALTAVATLGLFLATWWLIRKQSQISHNEMCVKFQINFEDKFEGSMKQERIRLAKQLLENRPHDEIQEDVMSFFESIGTLLRRGYLDQEMVWVGFSFYAFRWWNACKDYILEERRRHDNDETIFEEFQKLVDILYKVESKHRGKTRAQLEPGMNDIKTFLRDESGISIEYANSDQKMYEKV